MHPHSPGLWDRSWGGAAVMTDGRPDQPHSVVVTTPIPFTQFLTIDARP